MNGLESYSPLEKTKCDYYRRKIAEHTPPVTESDELIVRTYQRFLIRDRSLLYNLELLKLMAAMRKDSTVYDVSGMSSKLSMSPVSLDLDEIRALLDENTD